MHQSLAEKRIDNKRKLLKPLWFFRNEICDVGDEANISESTYQIQGNFEPKNKNTFTNGFKVVYTAS